MHTECLEDDAIKSAYKTNVVNTKHPKQEPTSETNDQTDNSNVSYNSDTITVGSSDTVVSPAQTKVKSSTSVPLRSVVQESMTNSLKKVSSAYITAQTSCPVRNTSRKKPAATSLKPHQSPHHTKRQKEPLNIVDGEQARKTFSAAVVGIWNNKPEAPLAVEVTDLREGCEHVHWRHEIECLFCRTKLD